MSAARHDRRNHRATRSGPYSRPASVKKPSGWSLAGLVDWLIPKRSASPENAAITEDVEDQDNEAETRSQDEAPAPPANAAQSLSKRGQQMEVSLASSSTIPMPGPPSRAMNPPRIQQQGVDFTTIISTPSRHPNNRASNGTPASASPAKTLQVVSDFLEGKSGSALSAVEVAGVQALLREAQEATEDQSPEPFRFTYSRSATPDPASVTNGNDPFTTRAGSSSRSGSPRKMLSSNPNGKIRWDGAASAKPARNRFRAPGFGSPRRTQSPQIKISTSSSSPTTTTTETKRRRVGEEAATSTAQPAVVATVTPATPPRGSGKPAVSGTAFPVSNAGPSNTTNAAPKANGSGQGSRVFGTGPAKPTRPAIGSPLRQGWSAEPDSPPSSSRTLPGTGSGANGIPHPQQQSSSAKGGVKPSPPTKTRAADFMETLIKEATPPSKNRAVVNPYQTASPVLPVPKKRPVRKTRADREQEQKERELARDKERQKAQEKTKGKGKELGAQAIIEATVPKGSKRSRPPPDLGRTASTGSTTAAAEGPRRSTRLKSPEPSVPNGHTSSLFAVSSAPEQEKQTAPKTSPEKKRPVAIVEEADDDDTSSRSSKKARKADATDLTVIEIDEDGQEATATGEKPAEVIEPSELQAKTKDSKSGSAPTSGPGMSASRSFRAGSVKTFAPREPTKLRNVFQPDGEEKDKDKDGEAIVVDEPAAPAALNSMPTTSLFAPPPAPKPAPAAVPTPAEKPTPAAGPSSDPKASAIVAASASLPTFTFTIPEAGPSTVRSHVQSRTSVLAMPVTSLPTFDFSKAPVPSKASVPAPMASFNWGAAGLKLPTSDNASGGWTCSTCQLSNPSSATEKCTICEAPAPASVSSAPKPNTDPLPKSTASFNWAAAGMAPAPSAASGGGWKCDVCQLSNPASATEKCTVCEAPKPGAAPAAPKASFDWARAGMKSQTTSGWDDGTRICDLQAEELDEDERVV